MNNLKKIRAIAIFKKEIGISPPQAYILLHCGISSIRSLALSTPNELERKICRLERILRVKTETDTSFTLLKEWIKKASQIDQSIEPTLEQLSENLRKGSRSGANVKIKIRKLEKISDGVSKPVVIGEVQKNVKMN